MSDATVLYMDIGNAADTGSKKAVSIAGPVESNFFTKIFEGVYNQYQEGHMMVYKQAMCKNNHGNTKPGFNRTNFFN